MDYPAYGSGSAAGFGGSSLERQQYASSSAPVIGGTVLPEAHEDQVKLGFSMIHNAYTSKVQHLDNELKGLKMNLEEQKSQASTLQRKNAALEGELGESHQRQQKLAEENRELWKNVQNLRRQLQRLEGLKKKVLDSIADEPEAPAIEYEPSYPSTPWVGAGSGAYGSGAVYGVGTPPPTYPFEPMGSAATRSQSPPRQPGFGGGGFDGRSVSPVQGSFGGGVGSGSVGGAGAAIDGKQFFRQARSQLSVEAFNDFLANIKKLNNQQQSRERTLDEARRIFGPELQHLYKDFEQLLNRHSV